MLESEARPVTVDQGITDRAISAERIPNFISAFGNHELKALTLIAMRDGAIYTDAVLKETVTHGTGLQLNRGRLSGYCRESLSPIGLVARELLVPALSVWGYQITESGRQFGIPLAGLLLQWSLSHPDFSLIQMFGATPSSSSRPGELSTPETMKRAAETRLKIFWEIITNPDDILNQAFITVATGESRGKHSLIEQHLENLERNNIINYETVALGKTAVKFRIKTDAPEGLPKPYKSEVSLSSHIFRLLTENRDRWLSTEDLIEILITRFSDYKNRSVKNLNWAVSSIFKTFRIQGYLEHEKFTKEGRTRIWLSGEQSEAIRSLVEVFDRIQGVDRKVMQEGRNLAQNIIISPDLCRQLVTKAGEKSPHASSTSPEDTFRRIALLLDRESNLTASQIRKKLAQMPGGKNIALGTLCALLKGFIEKEGLIAQESKSGRIYSLP